MSDVPQEIKEAVQEVKQKVSSYTNEAKAVYVAKRVKGTKRNAQYYADVSKLMTDFEANVSEFVNTYEVDEKVFSTLERIERKHVLQMFGMLKPRKKRESKE